MRPVLLATTVLLLGSPAWAVSKQRCMVHVLRDVAAEESPDYIMPKGSDDFGPITAVRVNRKTARMIFCAAGTYCYAASALDLTSPCRFESSAFSDDENLVFAPK